MLLNPSKFDMSSPRSRSRFNSNLTRIISVHALNSTDIATWFSWNKSLTNFKRFLTLSQFYLLDALWNVSHKVFFCWIAKVSKVCSSLVLTSIQNTPKSMECLHSFRSNKYNWGHHTIGTQLLRHWSIYTVRWNNLVLWHINNYLKVYITIWRFLCTKNTSRSQGFFKHDIW